MRNYLPVLIVGALIGTFTLVFILAYLALRRHKEQSDDNERHMSDGEIVKRLIRYAKPYWKSFVLVFFVLMLLSYVFSYGVRLQQESDETL